MDQGAGLDPHCLPEKPDTLVLVQRAGEGAQAIGIPGERQLVVI